MADAETLLNLEADEAAVRELLAENDGRLVRDEVERAIYWLDLRPLSERNERFFARVAWQRYPHAAPSVSFAESIGGPLGVMRAWPLISGYGAPVQICKPFTAEGYVLHPEWMTGPDAWPTDGNPFLYVADILQFDLNNGYGGRAQ